MMMVFPDAEGPNSFERSTLIVSVVPSTVISTFFMMVSSPPFRLGEPPTSHRSALNRNVRQITSARLLLIAVRYRKNPRKTWSFFSLAVLRVAWSFIGNYEKPSVEEHAASV